jgi:hypothetical protein
LVLLRSGLDLQHFQSVLDILLRLRKSAIFAHVLKNEGIMTLQEAIQARHSVRAYKNEPLAEDVVKVLKEQIATLNHEGNLHMQLILDEPKAFQGTLAKYGKFRNANNYIVMAGRKADDLDERVGYYGEHLVLLAQTLGLNTCWVGLSYSKVPGTYELDEVEKIACYIALGYGETQGVNRKSKTKEQMSNASDITPSWFKKGVEAALLIALLLLVILPTWTVYKFTEER